MLKDEQNRSYNGGGVSRPLKIWSDFSYIQYMEINTKPDFLGNPQGNITIERIHQVKGNLVHNLYIIYNKYM